MRLSHVAWNLGGLVVPLGVAAVTVPGLIDNLGNERFGLLALAWGLIGYAGALDLGVGRALTQRVATLRGERNNAPIPDTLATASRITLFAGLVGGALITIFVLVGGTGLIRVQNTPEPEITMSVLLLAIALPAQAISATYKGLNEAFMNFKGISLLRACLGVINFAGPYAVSFFSVELPWLVLTLVISRLMSLLVYKWLAEGCLKKQIKMNVSGQYSPIIARGLFSFGGWVTVSSVLSPILVQTDRFFIGATISASAVAVYVLPYEVVTQSLILVGAISSVMYPQLTRLMHEQPELWKVYLLKWVWRISLIMAPVCVTLALALPNLLPLWIPSISNTSSILIGQILCIGVFFNSIGSLYYASLHAKGRADITAKIHLAELPIYFILLIFLVENFNLIGAAMAWVARMMLDAGFLFLASRRV
jgi:O-antigen/teichoic acid export membrane protein